MGMCKIEKVEKRLSIYIYTQRKQQAIKQTYMIMHRKNTEGIKNSSAANVCILPKKEFFSSFFYLPDDELLISNDGVATTMRFTI